MKRIFSVMAVLLSLAIMAAPTVAATNTEQAAEAAAAEAVTTVETAAETTAEAAAATETVTAAATTAATEAVAAEPETKPAADPGEGYAAYEKAMKDMGDIRSMEMRMNMKATATVAGETLDINMKGDIAYTISEDGDMEMYMKTFTDDGTSSTVYYRDGYMYQVLNGEKVRYKTDIDSMLSGYEVDQDITADMIKKSSVTDTDNGGKRIRLTISGEAMTEMVDGLVAGMLEGMGLRDMGINVNDIAYTINLNRNGEMKNYRMVYGMQMNVLDMDMDVDYDMYCTVLTINHIKRVEFPSDINVAYQTIDLAA